MRKAHSVVHQATGTLMINLNKYEQEEYDSYTKDQVYEAFLSENLARINLQEQLKRAERSLAALRYDKKHFEEMYFRELVKKVIPVVDDENLDLFFSMQHQIIWVGKGFIGIQYIDGKRFVAYLYNANSYNTSKQIVRFFKGQEVYYVYEKDADYYKNNSKQYGDVMRVMI